MGVSKKDLRNKLKLAEQYVEKNPNTTIDGIRDHVRGITGVGLNFTYAAATRKRVLGRLLKKDHAKQSAAFDKEPVTAPKQLRRPPVSATGPEDKVAEILREAKEKLIAANISLGRLTVNVDNDGKWDIQAAFHRQVRVDI